MVSPFMLGLYSGILKHSGYEGMALCRPDGPVFRAAGLSAVEVVAAGSIIGGRGSLDFGLMKVEIGETVEACAEATRSRRFPRAQEVN
jgi:hypothetical protein